MEGGGEAAESLNKLLVRMQQMVSFLPILQTSNSQSVLDQKLQAGVLSVGNFLALVWEIMLLSVIA